MHSNDTCVVRFAAAVTAVMKPGNCLSASHSSTAYELPLKRPILFLIWRMTDARCLLTKTRARRENWRLIVTRL